MSYKGFKIPMSILGRTTANKYKVKNFGIIKNKMLSLRKKFVGTTETVNIQLWARKNNFYLFVQTLPSK